MGIPSTPVAFPYLISLILLVTGSEVRGFKPGRNLRIFSERRNPKHDFLRKGSKAPCRRFTARKEPHAEIRASEQKLWDFSRSL